MIKQIVFSIAFGNEDFNYQIYNRQNPLFQKAIVSDIALASCATLSQFERTIDRKELILDFDGTENKVHGNQTDLMHKWLLQT